MNEPAPLAVAARLVSLFEKLGLTHRTEKWDELCRELPTEPA